MANTNKNRTKKGAEQHSSKGKQHSSKGKQRRRSAKSRERESLRTYAITLFSYERSESTVQSHLSTHWRQQRLALPSSL